MIEEARDPLDSSSTNYLEEMEDTLRRIESALAQAADSMASMRGTLHRLVAFISAGNEAEPHTARPRILRPVPDEEVQEVVQHPAAVEAPVPPQHSDTGRGERTITPPVSEPPAAQPLKEEQHGISEEIDSKIDTAGVLSRIDERLRGLRAANAVEEPPDTAREA